MKPAVLVFKGLSNNRKLLKMHLTALYLPLTANAMTRRVFHAILSLS